MNNQGQRLLSITIIVTGRMTYLGSHHTFPFIVFCPHTVWIPILSLGYAIVPSFV